jgi:hypothetical protein
MSPAAAITYAGAALSVTALGLGAAAGDSVGDATAAPAEASAEGVADEVDDGSGVGEMALASEVACASGRIRRSPFAGVPDAAGHRRTPPRAARRTMPTMSEMWRILRCDIGSGGNLLLGDG